MWTQCNLFKLVFHAAISLCAHHPEKSGGKRKEWKKVWLMSARKRSIGIRYTICSLSGFHATRMEKWENRCEKGYKMSSAIKWFFPSTDTSPAPPSVVPGLGDRDLLSGISCFVSACNYISGWLIIDAERWSGRKACAFRDKQSSNGFSFPIQL